MATRHIPELKRGLKSQSYHISVLIANEQLAGGKWKYAFKKEKPPTKVDDQNWKWEIELFESPDSVNPPTFRRGHNSFKYVESGDDQRLITTYVIYYRKDGTEEKKDAEKQNFKDAIEDPSGALEFIAEALENGELRPEIIRLVLRYLLAKLS